MRPLLWISTRLFSYGVLVSLAVPSSAFGQGCVCQRQNASGYEGENAYLSGGDWMFSVVYQNFTSDRHYQGTTFMPALTARGPNNVQNAMGVSATYAVSNRFSLGVEAPFLTTSYTLNRVPPGGTVAVQEATHSAGLGDMSLRASYWLRSTYQAKQNVAFSVGLTAPTGAADLHNVIYGRDVPLDVSTQLGQKAWAPSVGVHGFRDFGPVAAFGSGVYSFDPRGTTNVPTFFGSLSNLNNKQMNSSADQFLFQAGIAVKPPFQAWRRHRKWPLPTLSYRVSGVPIHDVFGPSNGFRRPADIQFIEPGFSMAVGPQVVTFTTSILTYVNVKPTPANPNVTDATIPRYVFTLSFSRRVNGHHVE